MISGYSTFTSFPRVDDWSKDPQVLGRHINKSTILTKCMS